MTRVRLLIVVSLFCLSGVALCGSDGDPPAPAVRFIDLVWQRLNVESLPCSTMPDELHDALRCGQLEDGEIRRVAQIQALRLAEQGVAVLDMGLASTPLYQFAKLPGFEPFADVPGYSRTAFLVGEHRVAFWWHEHRLAVTLEPLDGPFPHYFPALVVRSD